MPIGDHTPTDLGQWNLPPEAIVYSGPLDPWAQRRIDAIFDQRSDIEIKREREQAFQKGFTAGGVFAGVLFLIFWGITHAFG